MQVLGGRCARYSGAVGRVVAVVGVVGEMVVAALVVVVAMIPAGVKWTG